MVARVLDILVDMLAGIALGACAIVAWWIGLGVVLVVATRVAALVDFPRGPVVIATLIAYCIFSLPACRWLERKVF